MQVISPTKLPDGWVHREARVNDLRFHYVEAGQGPLVVLLHGFPEFWYSWRHQIFNHRFWMTGNGILASLGTLLTPIPGPNVFFLYLAVRGYSHYRARAGALRSASIEILFIPSKILGDFLASIHHKPRSKVLPFLEPLAANMGLPRLPDYYREVILHKHP